jgi:hypothetical protein
MLEHVPLPGNTNLLEAGSKIIAPLARIAAPALEFIGHAAEPVAGLTGVGTAGVDIYTGVKEHEVHRTIKGGASLAMILGAGGTAAWAGAAAGAAGGTVVLPIIGTVGGGLAGGILGFIGGAGAAALATWGGGFVYDQLDGDYKKREAQREQASADLQRRQQAQQQRVQQQAVTIGDPGLNAAAVDATQQARVAQAAAGADLTGVRMAVNRDAGTQQSGNPFIAFVNSVVHLGSTGAPNSGGAPMAVATQQQTQRV